MLPLGSFHEIVCRGGGILKSESDILLKSDKNNRLLYEGLCKIVSTLVTNFTMVPFIIKVINMYVVSVVTLVLWLFSVLHNVHAGSGTHLDAYCTGTEVFFF